MFYRSQVTQKYLSQYLWLHVPGTLNVNVQNKKQVLESSLLVYLDSFIPECGKEPSLCSASNLMFYHRFFTSL